MAIAFQQNLDQAILAQRATDASPLPAIYLTSAGATYTCTNWLKWIVQWICDWLWNDKIATIGYVFQTALLDYYTEKSRALTPDYTLEQQRASVTAKKARLAFVVALIQANQATFQRYAPIGSSLRIAFDVYLNDELPLPITTTRLETALARNLQLAAEVATLRASKGVLTTGEYAGETCESLAKILSEKSDAIAHLSIQNREFRSRLHLLEQGRVTQYQRKQITEKFKQEFQTQRDATVKIQSERIVDLERENTKLRAQLASLSSPPSTTTRS